jgi:hypothetical protein
MALERMSGGTAAVNLGISTQTHYTINVDINLRYAPQQGSGQPSTGGTNPGTSGHPLTRSVSEQMAHRFYLENGYG